MKICSKCKQEKQLIEFYSSATSKDRLYPRCKDCDSKARQQWHRRNPERAKASGRNRHIKSVYGITTEDYNLILSKQNNVCAICSKEETAKGKFKLAIDHCHETNSIRGLLCNKCNRALGLFGENPDVIQRAKDYVLGAYG